MSLQRTRDALRTEVAKERARSSAAQARLDTFRASRWGLAAEVARDMARKPWRAPALALKVLKAARSKGARDANVIDGERLFGQKRYDEAVVAYDRALARDPANVRALQRKRDALSKMGSLSGMLAVVRQMQAVGDLEALRRAERALIGRLRELDTSWLPDLPGTRVSLEPQRGKVLHFLKFSLPYHTNGYTIRSHYTLRAQREAGLEPVAVTTIGFPRTDGVSDFEAIERPDGIPHHRLDLGADFPYKALPLDEQTTLNAWLLAEIAEQERPAIIHARSGFRGYETVLASLAVGKKYGIPVVYEISSFLESTWTADVEWAERGELYEMRSAQEVRCMREAAHVITIADSMRDEIIARGIDASKVTVIPNAVDASEFAPRAADPALLDKLGLTGKIVLGYISNLGAREGIEVLIEATSILSQQGANVGCLIVGEGPERARLEKVASDLDAPVRFTGAVAHELIKDYYAAIDVFVVPRIDDRAARWVTPLKPFEAAAMGKPLIVSALPALLEIASPDHRGLSFEPGNARALAEQAKRLVDDEALRAKLGDAAKMWVIAERTWTTNGERYRALYESILSSQPQTTAPAQTTQPEDEATLRAEIASLEDELAKMRGARKYAERAFRSSKVLRARGVVRAARAERGGTLKLMRNLKTMVKKARGKRGPSSLTPGTTPRGAVHAATAAAKLPDANPRDGSLLERGMEAIRLLDTERPVVLAYYPLVRNNPYQAMLYSSGWEHGIAAVPLLDLDALDDVPALRALGADVWFHIHWTAPILAKAEDRAHALAKLETFVHRLDALKKAGGKIAWSIHNVLPHEHRFRDLEIKICEALAARADMVHVLSDATIEQTKPFYTLRQETIRHIPLPGYLDVYPNLVSKAQARYELGIPAHATTFAMVGGIRKYKGVAGLIDAFENVAAERDDYRLIIAGPPIDFDDSTALQARCDAHPQIIGVFERVPENDLQIYLNAADVVVLPYEDILNSSVLMLAFAFGRPVVASRKGALAELVTDDVGMLFEHGKLEETLRAAEKLKEPRYAEAALERARAYPPKKMADDFARAVLDFR